jgi:hypothetical protein
MGQASIACPPLVRRGVQHGVEGCACEFLQRVPGLLHRGRVHVGGDSILIEHEQAGRRILGDGADQRVRTFQLGGPHLQCFLGLEELLFRALSGQTDGLGVLNRDRPEQFLFVVLGQLHGSAVSQAFFG